ncbi:MAG: hypothetical protein RIC55_28430 [Pirellulaceae bacterium]
MNKNPEEPAKNDDESSLPDDRPLSPEEIEAMDPEMREIYEAYSPEELRRRGTRRRNNDDDDNERVPFGHPGHED